jgi:hypothetical protein
MVIIPETAAGWAFVSDAFSAIRRCGFHTLYIYEPKLSYKGFGAEWQSQSKSYVPPERHGCESTLL